MKFNITIQDGIDDLLAVTLLEEVIRQGKISNDNTQYCYVTTWTTGHIVYADKTRTGNYTFRISREGK